MFETFANHLATTLEKTRLNTSLAQLRVAEQQLAYQASHDALTGLANRVLLAERVTAAIDQASVTGDHVSVLFLDLDDFKNVNDTLGHAAGDALLVEVARRIESCLRPGDTAARLGGDEFAVLVPNVSHEVEVRAIADRVLIAIGDPIQLEGRHVTIGVSIGIASYAGARRRRGVDAPCRCRDVHREAQRQGALRRVRADDEPLGLDAAIR